MMDHFYTLNVTLEHEYGTYNTYMPRYIYGMHMLDNNSTPLNVQLFVLARVSSIHVPVHTLT